MGTYYWADGDVYEGELRDGKRNGRGTFRGANGTIQSGIWSDGKFIG